MIEFLEQQEQIMPLFDFPSAAPVRDILERLLDDAVPGGVFIASVDRLHFANHVFAAMLGGTPKDFVDTDLLEHFTPQSRGWLRDALHGGCSSGLGESRLVGLLQRDGHTREITLRLRRALYLGASCFVGACFDVTESRRGERAMRDYARQLRALSRQVMDVQEDERRNLARELHDEIGQQLTILKLDLGRLAQSGCAPADIESALSVASSLMHQVRDLSLDLRPSMLDDLGLASAVRWYANRIARLASITLRVQIADEFPRLRPEVETLYFRVAQEAITNTMRHAGATSLQLRIDIEHDRIILEIADNGVGFDLADAREIAMRGGSAGLLGMQERASLYGGALEIVSAPGEGTTLRLATPVALAGVRRISG